MQHTKELLERLLPGVYVVAYQIGDGYWSSVLMSMESMVWIFSLLLSSQSNLTVSVHVPFSLIILVAKVEELCSLVTADPRLADGFNFVGFSQVNTQQPIEQSKHIAHSEWMEMAFYFQGGILGRGMLERCNQVKVKNFISWVAPQMGIYGVPKVTYTPLSFLSLSCRSF